MNTVVLLQIWIKLSFTDIFDGDLLDLTQSFMTNWHSQPKSAFTTDFLKFVIPETLPPLLMGSALASGGSVLDQASSGSDRHRRSFKLLVEICLS